MAPSADAAPTADTAPSARATLRVMTWNLWWQFGPYERRYPAIVETIRRADPDVLCLQEVWGDASGNQADDLAERFGMYVARSDGAPTGEASFGNAVLARWPIEHAFGETLPGPRARPSHRHVVGGVVATPYGPWPVASTHLDHFFDGSATRQLQAMRLLELASGWRGDGACDAPLVLGADLNAVPDSDEVRLLTGRRPGVPGIVFSDVWEQSGAGDGATWRSTNPYTMHSAWPNRRIDYLLVSWPRPKPVGNPIRAWLVGTEPVDGDGGGSDIRDDQVGDAVWPSDHAAVVADLTVPPG